MDRMEAFANPFFRNSAFAAGTILAKLALLSLGTKPLPVMAIGIDPVSLFIVALISVLSRDKGGEATLTE